MGVYYFSSNSFECPCDLRVAPKFFKWSFLRLFLEKTRLFGKVFASGSFVLYLTHSCQRLEPGCSETAFALKWLAFAHVWDDMFFLLNFVWSWDSYLKRPLLSDDCCPPNLPRFRYMLSGVEQASGQRCSRVVEYLWEPCAKHLSAYV